MQQGTYAEKSVRIGPRDKKLITDAYPDMTLYASTAYDPSSATPLKVRDAVDEVYFGNDGECGVGRGTLPTLKPASSDQQRRRGGPKPRRGRAAASKTQAPAPPPGDSMLPGDSSDHHGVSLSRAHVSDLTKQHTSSDSALAADGGAGGGGGEETIMVPGLGEVPRSSVPPHVIARLEERWARQRQHQLQQEHSGAQFPDYSSQQRAASVDGVTLPAVTLKRRQTRSNGMFGPLTRCERFLSGKLHQYLNWPVQRCDVYARPLFIVVVALVGCLAVVAYRKHKAIKAQRLHHHSRRHHHVRHSRR